MILIESKITGLKTKDYRLPVGQSTPILRYVLPSVKPEAIIGTDKYDIRVDTLIHIFVLLSFRIQLIPGKG